MNTKYGAQLMLEPNILRNSHTKNPSLASFFISSQHFPRKQQELV